MFEYKAAFNHFNFFIHFWQRVCSISMLSCSKAGYYLPLFELNLRSSFKAEKKNPKPLSGLCLLQHTERKRERERCTCQLPFFPQVCNIMSDWQFEIKIFKYMYLFYCFVLSLPGVKRYKNILRPYTKNQSPCVRVEPYLLFDLFSEKMRTDMDIIWEKCSSRNTVDACILQMENKVTSV